MLEVSELASTDTEPPLQNLLLDSLGSGRSPVWRDEGDGKVKLEEQICDWFHSKL